MGIVGTVALLHYDIWHAGMRNRGDRTRYGLKFLFDRVGEPTRPSWRHDPANLERVQRRFREKVCICSQSDRYKEIGLRREMWDHLVGAGAAGT